MNFKKFEILLAYKNKEIVIIEFKRFDISEELPKSERIHFFEYDLVNLKFHRLIFESISKTESSVIRNLSGNILKTMNDRAEYLKGNKKINLERMENIQCDELINRYLSCQLI